MRRTMVDAVVKGVAIVVTIERRRSGRNRGETGMDDAGDTKPSHTQRSKPMAANK